MLVQKGLGRRMLVPRGAGPKGLGPRGLGSNGDLAWLSPKWLGCDGAWSDIDLIEGVLATRVLIRKGGGCPKGLDPRGRGPRRLGLLVLGLAQDLGLKRLGPKGLDAKCVGRK